MQSRQRCKSWWQIIIFHEIRREKSRIWTNFFEIEWSKQVNNGFTECRARFDEEKGAALDRDKKYRIKIGFNKWAKTISK